MTKKSVFDQPGIDQLVPGQELPVGVKVTGRNLSAVALLVSLSGETWGTRTGMGACFEDDGSLSHVELHGVDGVAQDGTSSTKLRVKAGEFLTLGEDKQSLVVMDKDGYDSAKGFFGGVYSSLIHCVKQS